MDKEIVRKIVVQALMSEHGKVLTPEIIQELSTYIAEHIEETCDE